MSMRNHLTIVLPQEWYRISEFIHHSSVTMVWTTKETRAIPFKPQRLSLTEVLPLTKIPLWIPYQAQRLPFHLKSAREIGKSFNVDVSFCWNSSWKSDFWKENLPFCSNCHDSFWRKSRNRSFLEVFSQKIVCAHKKALPLHSKRLNNE